MSFTAQAKDELSRVAGACPDCAYAQLSASMRICGTLSKRGGGSYSLGIATETGAVARTIIKLTHELFDLETPLTVRHSVLRKTRNYLIELPEQEGLEEALTRLGILTSGQDGKGVASGVPRALLARPCCRQAFVRGAFMAGGFIADPRGDFHLEIAVSGAEFADDLVGLLLELGVIARLNPRRGSYAIYLKSFDDIVRLLRAMGARRSARVVENVRQVKSLKNDVNRRVNAELANQARSTGAAADQLALIETIERELGLEKLPAALREFCLLRKAHPEFSLAALGQLCRPPASKSAMYHRALRLAGLVDERAGQGTMDAGKGA